MIERPSWISSDGHNLESLYALEMVTIGCSETVLKQFSVTIMVDWISGRLNSGANFDACGRNVGVAVQLGCCLGA